MTAEDQYLQNIQTVVKGNRYVIKHYRSGGAARWTADHARMIGLDHLRIKDGDRFLKT